MLQFSQSPRICHTIIVHKFFSEIMESCVLGRNFSFPAIYVVSKVHMMIYGAIGKVHPTGVLV